MRMLPRFAGIAALSLATTPAFAIDIGQTATIDASAAKVWSTVGDFCAIADWHPAVEACETSDVDGTMRRTLTLAGGGGTLVEDLVSRDEAAMSYTYRIVEGPLPVENYESTISVAGDGEAATLSWTGSFDAKGASDEEAANVITGIYEAGIQSISEKAAAM